MSYNKELSDLIHKRVIKRLQKEVKNGNQIGGLSCNSDNLSSSGNFKNMIDQLACVVVNGIDAMVDGLHTAESVLTLPGDLAWDFERPNQPMPENTPIKKIMD
jgi:type 1 glutamine amidotransferase